MTHYSRITPTYNVVFDVVTEYPEKKHVSSEMGPSSMEEHVCHESEQTSSSYDLLGNNAECEKSGEKEPFTSGGLPEEDCYGHKDDSPIDEGG